MRWPAALLCVIISVSHAFVQPHLSIPDQTTSHSTFSGKLQRPYSIHLPAYVPDGLTPDEWAAIQKRERQERESKDYAAFGPHFRRGKANAGDWFLQSSLWTRGVVEQRVNGKSNVSQRRSILKVSLVVVCTLSNLLAPLLLLWRARLGSVRALALGVVYSSLVLVWQRRRVFFWTSLVVATIFWQGLWWGLRVLV